MPKLTVLIPCKDDRQHIRSCIESVRPIADEIVVADRGSKDGTLELVASLGGCRIVQVDGASAAEAQSRALLNARHEWVLVAGADERVPPELAREIRDAFAMPSPYDGYLVRGENFFLGHRLRFSGGSNSPSLRLVRREAARCQARGGGTVLAVSGKVGRLSQPMLRDVALYLDRFVAGLHHEATWSALDAYHAGKRATWTKMALHTPLRFLNLYLLRGGIFDGRAGLVACSLLAYATLLKDAKLWALQHSRVTADQTLTAAAAGVQQQQSAPPIRKAA